MTAGTPLSSASRDAAVPRRRARRIFFPALPLAACLLAAFPGTRLHALDSDPTVVDETTALSIGSTDIPRYLVDKNFNQFLTTRQQQGLPPPKADEIARWFRTFIANCVTKVSLSERGYLDRPEVRQAVDRMSRHILTKSDGPFYQSLYDSAPIPEERLARIQQDSSRALDALIIRFATEGSHQRVLQAPTGLALADRLRLVALGPPDLSVETHDGPIVWPFHPFQEIGEILARAEPGEIHGPVHGKLGIYYLLVHGSAPQSAAAFEGTREELARYVRDLDNLQVRRERRRAILQSHAFTLVHDNLAQLFKCLQTHRGLAAGEDPLGGVAPVAQGVIATYVRNGERGSLTSTEFVRALNHRMIRQFPTTLRELATSVEDVLVEDVDYEAACQAGLNQTPRFILDRLNFASNQALAIFEQTELAPTIPCPEPEIRAFYIKNLKRYSSLRSARVSVFAFANIARANEALGYLSRGDIAGAARLADEGEESLVLTADGPPVFTQVSNPMLLQLRDGQPLGPLDRAGRPTLFLRHPSSDLQPEPFRQVEGRVRADFIREHLDNLAVARLGSVLATGALRLRFDPVDYGADPRLTEDLRLVPQPAGPAHPISSPSHPHPIRQQGGGLEANTRNTKVSHNTQDT